MKTLIQIDVTLGCAFFWGSVLPLEGESLFFCRKEKYLPMKARGGALKYQSGKLTRSGNRGLIFLSYLADRFGKIVWNVLWVENYIFESIIESNFYSKCTYSNIVDNDA